MRNPMYATLDEIMSGPEPDDPPEPCFDCGSPDHEWCNDERWDETRFGEGEKP